MAEMIAYAHMRKALGLGLLCALLAVALSAPFDSRLLAQGTRFDSLALAQGTQEQGRVGTQEQTSASERAKERHLAGHSAFGEAYDEGPRQRPSKIPGIGATHFAITTKNPEVQAWFDQGNTLLHSFWYYEAERAFRWASKLEPDNPMPYLGLVRSVGGGARARAFMKEAQKRKANVSERERAYIDAFAIQYDDAVPQSERRNKFMRAIESLVMKFPHDIEAKALLGDLKMGSDRVGTDLLMKQVLAAEPNHPGAHHYRIHNWDDEDGALALDSCRLYGDIAPGIGHALHMPGHIYAGIGMFHESAISLDSATRAEIAYMNRQMVFPYNTWNYAHNRNYLSYVQEQLGLASEAIRGARELLSVPLDPKDNGPTGQTPYWQGLAALSRALIKYERWDEILKEGSIPWRDQLRDKLGRRFAEASAHIGKKNLEAAQKAVDDHNALKSEIDGQSNSTLKRQFEVQDLELRGSLALLKGDGIDGLTLLTQAAPKELEQRSYYDDPPFYPTLMWSKIGYAYLDQASPKLAVDAFTRALKAVPNDPFALAGLVRAHHALGDTKAATDALGRLEFVWSDAEADLRWLRDARATGLKAAPIDRSPAKQRNYAKTTLTQFGPAIWTPFAAPALDVTDSSGKRLALDQFRGKNVILVFYLGVGCPHCIKQLKDLSERASEYGRLDAEIIAVSQDRPESNAKSQDVSPLKMKIASDDNYAVARRFKSYDDFEEMGIHSTILIDKQGRVYWAKHGGSPFDDFKFLSDQLRRMNEKSATGPAPSVTVRDK
jgi:peroxiredoxin